MYHLSLLNVDNKEDDSRLVEFPNVQAIINKKKKKKNRRKQVDNHLTEGNVFFFFFLQSRKV